MGKTELVEALAENIDGLSKKAAGEIVDLVFDSITSALKDGGRVQIPGFGSFSISHRKERSGRNPRTGEAITIAASNSVSFKAGKALKEAVN